MATMNQDELKDRIHSRENLWTCSVLRTRTKLSTAPLEVKSRVVVK